MTQVGKMKLIQVYRINGMNEWFAVDPNHNKVRRGRVDGVSCELAMAVISEGGDFVLWSLDGTYLSGNHLMTLENAFVNQLEKIKIKKFTVDTTTMTCKPRRKVIRTCIKILNTPRLELPRLGLDLKKEIERSQLDNNEGNTENESTTTSPAQESLHLDLEVTNHDLSAECIPIVPPEPLQAMAEIETFDPSSFLNVGEAWFDQLHDEFNNVLNDCYRTFEVSPNSLIDERTQRDELEIVLEEQENNQQKRLYSELEAAAGSSAMEYKRTKFDRT